MNNDCPIESVIHNVADNLAADRRMLEDLYLYLGNRSHQAKSSYRKFIIEKKLKKGQSIPQQIEATLKSQLTRINHLIEYLNISLNDMHQALNNLKGDTDNE